MISLPVQRSSNPPRAGKVLKVCLSWDPHPLEPEFIPAPSNASTSANDDQFQSAPFMLADCPTAKHSEAFYSVHRVLSSWWRASCLRRLGFKKSYLVPGILAPTSDNGDHRSWPE